MDCAACDFLTEGRSRWPRATSVSPCGQEGWGSITISFLQVLVGLGLHTVRFFSAASALTTPKVWFASLAVSNPIHIAMAMFARATSNLVHQIDPDGSLIPVTRLNNSHKLVPLALVLKRRRRWFWQTPKYRPRSGVRLPEV
ncbi:hypothetical protein JZ751_016248 [Albula glossodonta]|uniref:Gasdermin pore forming domain-containing protein n=1 Tax=Albula glossodonta TaxID=121402 RepID=A0A8T2N0V4_9TELE|nr:hypothetical protein JZ751_016248 [Albula glossodonta]